MIGRERIRVPGRKYRPDEAGDFAIGNIRGLDTPFTVRIENYFDKKAGISLIDVEIAGQRTMVTRRFGQYGMADCVGVGHGVGIASASAHSWW